MDLRAQLDAACQTLAQALQDKRVPRPKRRGAREVLRRAFLATQQADGNGPEGDLEGLLDEVAALMPPPPPFEPLMVRLSTWTPVRMRFAIDRGLSDRVARTYTGLGDRLDEITEWFWARCKPEGGIEARDQSVQERALDEFGTEDMEYVWGRKRRPPT